MGPFKISSINKDKEVPIGLRAALPSAPTEKQQELEDEEHARYVPADQDLHRGAQLSTAAPPNERPGARRGAEMRKLYGADAAKIQAMEAALQLNFDRNCDRKLPKYWPVIPLRL